MSEEEKKQEEINASSSEEVTAEETQSNAEEEPSEVELLKEEIESLEDRNLRLQAEIQNMQRINKRERQDAAKYRSQSLAQALLDSLDNLERALSTEVTSDDAKGLYEGVEMVYNQILHAFETEKIEVIDPVGEPFDPNFHQAVSMIPLEEDKESQEVAQVLQKGYILNDRVIRPAMVIVYE